MSVNKANRFIRAAKAGGWSTRYFVISPQDLHIKVTATRGPEKLVIEWHDNTLGGSPLYSFHEMTLKVHSRKDAERILSRIKPDMDQYQKWQKRNRPKTEDPLSSDEGFSEAEVRAKYADLLPFNIHEDTDATILKAIRGNTVMFRNSISGNVESEFVPFKTSDGRVFNYDTENVFFLSENAEGRGFLSFMNSNGVFRSVHLDRILAVV